MPIDTIRPNQRKAVFLAKRQLSELVCDAVNLEGIHYTLPEIQTLLDGITVGGHKLSDQTIALNQANAWKYLFQSIENGHFSLSQDYVCYLHHIAAQNEALTWGEFRTGNVTISGTDYLPPKADQLPALWQQLIFDFQSLTGFELYHAAIRLFLDMARIQFFYDVNKRMGRFMMNGILLNQGYPAINLPAKYQQQFNELMLAFYQSNDKGPMTEFMLSCLSQSVIEIMSE